MLDLARVKDFIGAVNWKFAKTYAATAPHEYIVKDTLSTERQAQFEWLVMHIRENGKAERFFSRIYIYLYIGKYKYWTMGDPLETTILINRAEVKLENEYDIIADKYDSLFLDSESVKETQEIIEMIKPYLKGRTLDIGCGTGLIIDYSFVTPENYFGVDPSSRMIQQLIKKHPSFNNSVLQAKFEDYHSKENFDFIVSLFGSINYVEPKHLERIKRMLSYNGKYFLMFYKPEYHPITCIKSGVEIKHYITDLVNWKFESVQDELIYFNNFIIATNI